MRLSAGVSARLGEEMTGASPDSVLVNTIGPLITAAIGAAIGWLPGGSTGAMGSVLTSLLAVAGAICARRRLRFTPPVSFSNQSTCSQVGRATSNFDRGLRQDWRSSSDAPTIGPD